MDGESEPPRDLRMTYEAARYRLKRKGLKAVRKGCPEHTHLVNRSCRAGFYYIRTQSNICFVAAKPATIVTVSDLSTDAASNTP